MVQRECETADCGYVLRHAFLLLAIIAVMALCFLCPVRAYAASDTIGYAYLEPESDGSYTALVLSRDLRPESQTGFRYLGPIEDGAAVPWDGVRNKITSFRIEGETLKPKSGLSSNDPSPEASWFTGCSALKHVDLANLNTSAITDMSSMFQDCSALASIDNLAGLDTLGVKSMRNMFAGCWALTAIDLSGFDTWQVTDMSGMFDSCISLAALDLSSLDTSHVTDMGGMFSQCAALTELDVSSLDTSQVTYMANMFSACNSLTELDLSGLDMSNVTNMTMMFYYNKGVVSIDLSGLDTSNVIEMNCMFDGCDSLASINLSGFDTPRVTGMSSMFAGCFSLASLDLSSFDTSQVQYMGGMFAGCSSLTELDLSGFDTSHVKGMSSMFYGCTGLRSLDISRLDTSQVENVEQMFDGCMLTSLTIGPLFGACDLSQVEFAGNDWTEASLAGGPEAPMYTDLVAMAAYAGTCVSPVCFVRPDQDEPGPVGPELPAEGMSGTCAWAIDIQGNLVVAPAEGETGRLGEYPSWFEYAALINTARFSGTVELANNGSRLFAECANLRSVDLAGLDVSKSSDLSCLFQGCSSLAALDLSGFVTSEAHRMDGMFDGCSSLTELDVSGFDTSRVVDMSRMFAHCESLAALDVSGFNTAHVENMNSMFEWCGALTELDVSGFDTSNVWGMSSMFWCCYSLTSLDVTGFDTSRVTSMYRMFSDCSALPALDLSSFDTSNVYSMASMFEWDWSLTFLDLSGFNTANVYGMQDMFGACRSLTSLDLSSFDTAQVGNMNAMFSSCRLLESLDVSSFDTSNVSSMNHMFSDCRSLANLDLSSFKTPSLTSAYWMFYDCASLASLDISGFDFSHVVENQEIFKDCNALAKLHLGEGSTGLPLDQLPLCYWRSSGDGGLYRSADIPLGVDAVYGRETHDERIMVATLDGTGNFAISVSEEVPQAQEGQAAYVVSVYGYDAPSEVPWHDRRADIRQISVEGSLSTLSVAYWFCSCPNLTTADFANLDTARATAFDSMLRDCTALTDLSLPIDTGFATSMRRMLHGCSALQNVSLGSRFTFRGALDRRLPGAELPDGAWRPSMHAASAGAVSSDGGDGSGDTPANAAYASDSIPSFVEDTYRRVAAEDLEGVTVISLYGENTGQEYVEEAVLTADGDLEVSYDLSNYEGDEFVLGGSPSASEARPLNNKTVGKITLADVKDTRTGKAVSSVVIGPRVEKIRAGAFKKAPSLKMLKVKSMKLNGKSRVSNCLAGSNITRVMVYQTAKANKFAKAKRVARAFASYAGTNAAGKRPSVGYFL